MEDKSIDIKPEETKHNKGEILDKYDLHKLLIFDLKVIWEINQKTKNKLIVAASY